MGPDSDTDIIIPGIPELKLIPDADTVVSAMQLSGCDNIEFCGVNEIVMSFHTNIDALKKLRHTDLGASLEFSVTQEHDVPKRHHRKRRIQKKWNKRYGVWRHIDSMELKECTLIPGPLSADTNPYYNLYGEDLEVKHKIISAEVR